MLASKKFKGLVEFSCEETKYEKVLLLLKYLNHIYKEKNFFLCIPFGFIFCKLADVAESNPIPSFISLEVPRMQYS
jgi:hypothetical protein